MEITDLSITELAAALRDKRVSAVEATRACLDKIHKTRELNNFISLCEERAMTDAARADAMIARGELSSLCGVPLAVKDNICVSGVRCTCGSRLFEKYVPEADATVVRRLEKAGAVIIGKTNMDELAMGSTDESSAFGAVKNALDISRVPGGSSGGSANCVAARQAFGALGTDTGGSIRQPAAYCGTVGLKPTFGVVPTDGLVGFCRSLDTVGVFARDCDGALTLFGAIAGRNDIEPLDGDVRGKTIGIADEIMRADTDDGVRLEFESAVKRLSEAGANIVRVAVNSFCATLSAYHILSSAEASESILRFAGDDKSKLAMLGAEVRRRIVTGATVKSGDNFDDLYVRAAKVRAVIKREYESALERCDAFISPATSSVATLLGEGSDPIKTHKGDYFLAGVSLAGLPAASVPCGYSVGLPVGMQIIGGRNGEREILNIGKAVMRGNVEPRIA